MVDDIGKVADYYFTQSRFRLGHGEGRRVRGDGMLLHRAEE